MEHCIFGEKREKIKNNLLIVDKPISGFTFYNTLDHPTFTPTPHKNRKKRLKKMEFRWNKNGESLLTNKQDPNATE